MEKSFLSNFIKKETEKIKSFLISKDLLIFLFLLLVSAGMWTLQALHKEYETIITIPVRFVNLPEESVIGNELPEKLYVTVTDGGATLVKYRFAKRFDPIDIDVSEYVEGEFNLDTDQYISVIQKQLNTSTRINRVSPDFFELDFRKIVKKELEVKLRSKITIAQQYVQTDSVKLIPQFVTVLTTKEILDTMQYAYTEMAEMLDVKDTAKKEISLQQIEGVRYSPSTVTCQINTEPYTENVMEVPIISTNVPQGYHLRTFPANATVKYHIGHSKYKTIKHNSFVVKANYVKSKDTKIKLELTSHNDYATNIVFTPKLVDYIIEKDE